MIPVHRLLPALLIAGLPLAAYPDGPSSNPPLGPTCDSANQVQQPSQTMSTQPLSNQQPPSDCATLNKQAAADSTKAACTAYNNKALPIPSSVSNCLQGLLSQQVSNFGNFNVQSMVQSMASQIGKMACTAATQSINNAVNSVTQAVPNPASLVQQGLSAAQQGLSSVQQKIQSGINSALQGNQPPAGTPPPASGQQNAQNPPNSIGNLFR